MKITRVQYTVQSDFVEENKRNTAAVMRELRALGNKDLHYAVYLHEDGKTFMHLAQHGPTAEHLPVALDSFKHFRSQLNGHFEAPPKQDKFTLVESSSPIF